MRQLRRGRAGVAVPGDALCCVRAASHFGFQFGAREAENEEAIEYEEPPSGHEQGLNTADE